MFDFFFLFQMSKFRFYLVSFIIYLSISWITAQKSETNNTKPSAAKPYPKGNKHILFV